MSGVVAPRAIFFDALHHDPVEIAAEFAGQLGRVDSASLGTRAPFPLRNPEPASGSDLEY